MHRFIIGVAILAVAAPCLSHDLAHLPLEDLLAVEVASASRHAQPLSETPSTVTVVTAEDVRRFGFRDLAEALQMARGVYATNDRAYSYLGVRGFGRPGDYNSRILLLQDGYRSNDPVYDQAMLGHEAPIEIDWIKRLEFVPGPASALYGGNALFGIANAILWSGADLDGTRLALDAGNNGLGRASLLAGRQETNGLDWVAGLVHYGRRGEDLYFRAFDVPGVGNGVAHALDGERYTKALLKLGWENWRASLGFSTRHKNVPTAYFGTNFDTPGNFTRDQSLHLDLVHGLALTPTWDQQLRLHLGAYRYDGDYLYGPESAVNRDSAQANWWSAEYQLRHGGWQDHAWLFGVETRRQTRLAQKNYDLAPYAERLDVSRRGHGTGIFIQDEWRFAPRWLANIGVRSDSQQAQPSMASPRLAVIHRATDATNIKLLYGKAFRAPNDYETRYADNGNTQKANPGLRPERIVSRELAVDTMLAPTVRWGVGHYRYTLRDLIDQETDPADGLLVFRNQASAKARGWETEMDAALTGGWRLRGSLAWQTVTQPGGPAPNSPQRLGKLFLDGPLPWGAWALGLNLQAVSERKTLTASVPGYITGNVLLRQAGAGRDGEWSVGVYNMAGRRHWQPVGREVAQDAIPTDGRQLRVRWEFVFR